jgi:drug/metabolite transporter (DMT)-like permease
VVIGLAIAAALALGVGDFMAGVALRRDGRSESAITYAAAGLLLGTLIAAVAILLVPPDHISRADVLWSVGAGVAIGLALPLVMIGMARGPIAVIAPVLGLMSLAVPAIVGPLLGDQLSTLEIAGLAIALPATALVATSSGPSSKGLPIPMALLLAAVAGSLFGSAGVFFGQTSPDSGIGPAVVSQVVATVLLLGLAASTGRLLRPTRHALMPAALVGVLATFSALASILAYQRGPVAVVEAVIGMRPGPTVLMAWLLLQERINRVQAIGFTLGIGAVVLFAIG